MLTHEMAWLKYVQYMHVNDNSIKLLPIEYFKGTLLGQLYGFE